MLTEFTFSLVVLAAGFISTVAVTYFLMRAGERNGFLDIPNERSSHSVPVPRGGGVAVIVTFLVFLLIYPGIIETPIVWSVLSSLMFGGALVAVIGFLDDLKNIAAKWRFLTHLSAAVLSLSLLPSIPELEIFDRSLDLGLFGYAFLAISLVWFVNLFNFMDGIDGIAGIQTITVSLGAAFILFVQGDVVWLTPLSFLVVCVAGFLVWNWAPAKVFMGDACSGFLGFMLGLFAIITSVESTINLWTWLILSGVFLIDATTTLITRITRGEKWYEAHRSHAYQILSRRFRSHKKVTLAVAIINIVWLLPSAYLSAIYPQWALVICIGSLMPLLVVAIRVGAGRSEIKGATV